MKEARKRFDPHEYASRLPHIGPIPFAVLQLSPSSEFGRLFLTEFHTYSTA